MLSPLEILLDPISLIVIVMYLALMLWEAIWPAKQLPYVKYWKLKGIASFIFFFYLSSYLPMLIDPYLADYQLFDLSHFGVGVSAFIGIMLYELGIYVWHRSMHSSDVLWKSFHQMHHSAERLDTYGAFYFSPLDMIGFTVLGSLCFALLIGLNPKAITVIILITTFFSIFQHANIKTPWWLGFLIQRPESHALHHARGIHKYNYSDIPLFDMLLGTFHNPRDFEYETGFYDGASDRIMDMLLFKDVSHDPAETASLNQQDREPAELTSATSPK